MMDLRTPLISYRNRADGCGAIQRDSRRLKVWVNRNLTMFKEECDVLNMERDNLRQQYESGDDQPLENSSAEKGLNVLVHNKLTVNQQCGLMPKMPKTSWAAL